MRIFEPDPGSTLIVGRGFNSLTLDEKAIGIVDENVIRPMGAAGQIVTYEIRQIEDITELRKSLNVSASASLAGGVGAGSIKGRFISSLNFNSYSLFLFIHVRVANASHALKDYLLTETAINFLKEYGRDAFFETFGDEFVAGYTTGGELIAIVEIRNQTIQEKMSLETSMKGKYGSFSGSAEFSQAIESLNVSNATRAHVVRRGGTGPIPDTPNLKQASLDFPGTVEDATGNAILLQIKTMPYALTTNRPNNIPLLHLEQQRIEMESVAVQRERAIVKRADYKFAANYPYLFSKPDVGALNAAIHECDLAINKIDESVKAALLDHGKVFINPGVVVPEIPLEWVIPTSVPLSAMVHMEGYGDVWGGADQFLGTRGQNRRIEGIAIAVNPPLPGLYIEYFVHMEGIGDSAPVRDGAYCGTRGQSRRIEGFQIRLKGPLAPFYDVIYLGHIQSIGDVQKQNDEYCGTRGQNFRCEGMQVRIVRK